MSNSNKAKPSRIARFFSASRSLYYWVVMILITILTGLLTLPFMIFRMSRAMHAAGLIWGRTLGWLAGIQIDLEGGDRLQDDGRPVIYIANHQSMVDILVFFSVLRGPFAWMAKASLFKIPLFGWGMSAAGYIPVERDDRRKALDSLYTAADLVKAGRSVVIFPEGTRGHPDGSMRSFKKGGFILAKRAAVTIQPITIHGASAIMPPRQAGTRVQRIKPGKVQMLIHPPIQAAEYADATPEELSERVRAIIEAPLAGMQARA